MSLKKKIGMAKNFAQALVSRGVSNKKTEPYTKKLRVLSCFGNEHIGGNLPPCEHLRKSATPDKFFCNGCGCGDKPRAWLLAEGEEYSKLDYPVLSCPLKMPGFSDYEVSSPEEGVAPITRRYYIENMSDEQVKSISITEHEMPEEEKKKAEEYKDQ